MPDSARHARLLIMPTLSSKLPHSNFAQDVEEQMEFGNLDNWVSQELQHFGPFIGQRGENVHLCPSSFWSCGIFCMQYTCNHPYMLFVFPGQKQAKKRTTLLRECVKNSSLNTAGRSCNSCRRHMISSQYIYIHCISYHAGFGKYATPPAQHQCGTCQSVRTRKSLRMIEVWDFHRSSASDSSTACLRNWQDWKLNFLPQVGKPCNIGVRLSKKQPLQKKCHIQGVFWLVCRSWSKINKEVKWFQPQRCP